MRADLTIHRDACGETYLRADEIRHSTLLALAAAWADDRSAVIDTLDELASVAAAPRRPEGELDAALDDVESVCGMGLAEMRLGRPDLVDLINAALTAYPAGRPAGPVVAVGSEHGSAVAA